MPQCSDKKPFTKREAQENRNHRSRRGAQGLRIYQCYVCDGWHLTSKPDFYKKKKSKNKEPYKRKRKEWPNEDDELL